MSAYYSCMHIYMIVYVLLMYAYIYDVYNYDNITHVCIPCGVSAIDHAIQG